MFRGLGQRILTTDEGEFPLMDVRAISIESAASDDEGAAAA